LRQAYVYFLASNAAHAILSAQHFTQSTITMQAKRKLMQKSSNSFVSINQLLPLKHSFQFKESQGVFCLSLESTVPIFCVAVTATVDVEFLELQGSVAILTVCEALPGSTARSMATYR
jgi:hypothetical protein